MRQDLSFRGTGLAASVGFFVRDDLTAAGIYELALF